MNDVRRVEALFEIRERVVRSGIRRGNADVLALIDDVLADDPAEDSLETALETASVPVEILASSDSYSRRRMRDLETVVASQKRYIAMLEEGIVDLVVTESPRPQAEQGSLL